MRGKIAMGLIPAALAALMSAPAALAASPGPAWAIRSLAQPTNFSRVDNGLCEARRECDSYSLTVTNTGAEPMSEAPEAPIVISDTLPSQIVVQSIEGRDLGRSEEEEHEASGLNRVQCTVAPLQCEYGEPIPPGDVLQVTIKVSVAPGAAPSVTNRAEVRGGGATAAYTEEPLTTANPVDGEPAGFGIQSFAVTGYGPDGGIDTQAGDHPYALTASVDFNTAIDPITFGNSEESYGSVQEPKSLSIEFPVGLISDLQTVGECPESALFNPPSTPACPPDSRVGTAVLNFSGRYLYSQSPEAANELTAIYNMVPERGHAAVFGMGLIGAGTVMYADLVPTAMGYRVRITIPAIPRPTFGARKLDGVSLTLFGDPAERDGTPSASAAFFANPTSCSDSAQQLQARIEVSSWVNPAAPVAKEVSVYPWITGCDKLRFDPTIAIAPQTTQADSPSGYEVDLRVLQPPNVSPNLAAAQLRDATITLPAGVTISAPGADGRVGCSSEEIDLLGTETGPEGILRAAPGRCPDASRIGAVAITTPLVTGALEGHIYLAQPQCGGRSECTEADAETGRMLGLYLEVAGQGIDVKLPGEIEVGGYGAHSLEAGLAPGQVRVRFAQAPQLPFSELKLQLDGGPRAPLANPQSCGEAQTWSVLAPWSVPQGSAVAMVPSQPFAVTGCAGEPFNPGFLAQTAVPFAGGSTPYTVGVSRADDEQDLGGIEVTNPPGLLAEISRVPLCGEPQAAQGTCASASGVGTVTVAAGAGSHPLWLSGPVYLTGPYRGAPFGLSVVVPVRAGPFDLGEEVLRSTIHIDPHTAAVTIASDSLPTSTDGIPLRLRTVNLTVDRPGFIFNPTSCRALRVEAKITGEHPAGSSEAPKSAQASTPFAVAGCRNLPFKPSLSASTRGRASTRGKGASLTVKIAQKRGEANIKSVRVALPRRLPARLSTLQRACPQATFAANPASCPAASVVGSAVARTPLLAAALAGPLYFVSHGGAKYPELIVALQGDGVTIDLAGETYIDTRTNITSVTFATVPDAPIGSLELKLPERSNSALASPSGNLCGKILTMPTTITAQNGARIRQSTKVSVSGCPKHRKVRQVKGKERGRG
jgi:hypothetical protein